HLSGGNDRAFDRRQKKWHEFRARVSVQRLRSRSQITYQIHLVEHERADKFLTGIVGSSPGTTVVPRPKNTQLTLLGSAITAGIGDPKLIGLARCKACPIAKFVTTGAIASVRRVNRDRSRMAADHKDCNGGTRSTIGIAPIHF